MTDFEQDQAAATQSNPASIEQPKPSAPELTDPTPATARLRAFEDEHLGPDTPRIGGHIERGSGAPIRNLSPELQREYAAIERLVESEKKVDEAANNLAKAEVHHEVAIGHADAAAEHLDAVREPKEG